MNNPANLKALLAGSVLTAAFAVPSSAQTLNVDIAELEGKSEECRSLGQFIADQGGSIAGAEPTRVADAVNNDVAQECADIQALLTTEAGAAQDSATAEAEAEATTESVVTSEEATIVGEAVVRVPEPNVDVRVPQPEVTVRQAPPQVSVQDGAAQIEVEQAQPEIAVEIPTINVRVTMPAPSIYVLQGDPQVSVTEADPQVEVVQGEPEIIVTQPDPQLDIGLGVAQGEQAPTDQAQDTAEGDGAQQVSGNVDLEQQQPIVSFVAPAEEPQVDITRAEPEVSFSGATQPNVTITMTEEPTVDVQMTGEPRVTIETPEEREQRRAGQQAAAADAPAADAPVGMADPAAGSADAGAPANAGQMTVGDVMLMTVVTADGQDLGNPEGVIDMEGQQYLLLSSGGFMGLGDKVVPVPLTVVSMNGEQLVLGTVTEADIQRARDFQYDENQAMQEDQPVAMTN